MNKAVFVIGPTASGKTSLGVDIARKIDSEIISIDSRQVYTGLDLGTGKDIEEFGEGDDKVSYHLIDIADPVTDEYNLHTFLRDVVEAMQGLWHQGKIPVLVGGTSLYINALLNGYDLAGCPPNLELRRALEPLPLDELVEKLKAYPSMFAKTDKSTKKRVIRAIEVAVTAETTPAVEIPEFDYILLAPYYHRKICHQRVEQRLDQRLADGMVEEVQGLHASGVSWEKLDWFGLEYRYISMFLRGELERQEMRDRLLIKIRQFLKAQTVWLRKMEREGKDIYWIPDGNRSSAFMLVKKFLSSEGLPLPSIKISEIHYGPKQ